MQQNTLLSRHLFSLAFIVSLAHPLSAKDDTLTIETKSHASILTLESLILPQPKQALSVSSSPLLASPPEIISILPNGTPVEKDSPLITFDTKDLDRQIAEETEALKLKKLTLDHEKATLAALEKDSPQQLAESKRLLEIAQTDHDYTLNTEIPSLEKQATHTLTQSQHSLEYIQEELRQLQKMYDADDLTEETEEIILTRHKRAVQEAQFQLTLDQENHKKTTTIELPRKAKDQAAALQKATTEFEKSQREIPHALAKKQQEVAELERTYQLAEKDLNQLNADRALFPLKAPISGTLHYGHIENGQWKMDDLAKTLRPGGSLPTHSPALTIIPNSPLPEIHLHLSLEDHLSIQKVADTLKAWVQPHPDTRIPLSIVKSPTAPSADQTYHYILTSQDPAHLNLFPIASSPSVNLTIYHAEQAIVIPTSALHFIADGTPCVRLKLADGKAKDQPIQIGSQSEKETVVINGLQSGQVIFK